MALNDEVRDIDQCTSEYVQNDSTDDDRPVNTFSIPASQRVKRESFDFYEKTLGSPKYVVSHVQNQIILLMFGCKKFNNFLFD